MISIADFLDEKRCIHSLLSGEKEGALRKLCKVVEQSKNVDADGKLFDYVWAREQVCSTGIGEKVAIPHVKINGARSLTGVFGVSKKGVDFHAPDGADVTLIFLLVGSMESPGDHLKGLARVARLLKDRDFQKKAVAATNDSELYDLIVKRDLALSNKQG